MKIGVDASRSIDSIQKTGVEKVSDGLLRALNFSDKDNALIFYTPELISWLPREKQKIIKGKYFWTLFRLSKYLKKNKPSVFFSPVHELPFFLPKKTFRLIHDIAFVKEPRTYGFIQKMYLNFGLKRSAGVCDRIFVSTGKVKNDLLKYSNIKEEKIIITGLGYEKFKNKPEANRKKQILYIGRIEAKKNIINLIKAFEIFNKDKNYKLILVGKKGFGFEEIKKEINDNQNIKLLGYISDKDKLQLLCESSLLLHVPSEEGFSYPLLEAFDCGLPVVASQISVLQEVGGGACVYVEQKNPKDIALGIDKLINNKSLQQELIEKGKERLKNYSWEKVARQVLEILKS